MLGTTRCSKCGGIMPESDTGSHDGPCPPVRPSPPPAEFWREGSSRSDREARRAKPLRCRLGLHDWRRRSDVRAFGELCPEAAGGPLGGEMLTVRFEQCRRCDKTRNGWRYDSKLDAPKPPKPMPWNDEVVVRAER